jgi:hypothetical protein
LVEIFGDEGWDGAVLQISWAVCGGGQIVSSITVFLVMKIHAYFNVIPASKYALPDTWLLNMIGGPLDGNRKSVS